MPRLAPEPAPSSARAAGRQAEFVGVVCSGLGEGARFTALDWVSEEFRRRLGFVAWPGTLNLRMTGAEWERWRTALHQHGGIGITPAPGYCAARCFEVRLNAQVRAAAIFPEVAAYPADKLELVAPVALRPALGLSDGDRVRVQLDY